MTETSYQMKSFTILQSGKSITSFNKINSVNFYGKKSKIKLSGVLIFLRMGKKKFKSAISFF